MLQDVLHWLRGDEGGGKEGKKRERRKRIIKKKGKDGEMYVERDGRKKRDRVRESER